MLDYSVVVALQNNAHNVFADIMDISFYCGQQNGSVVTFSGGVWVCKKFRGFLYIHKGDQICHGFFHHPLAVRYIEKQQVPCAFDNLRQKHFSRTKQVSHNIHATH
jgi:hypothetical protein